MKKLVVIISALISAMSCSAPDNGLEPDGKWTAAKAEEWYQETGWRSGCNYLPANAINQIEMWSSDTFDPAAIDKELGWAEELGFRTMRVFLSSLVWENEADAFKKHIDEFLTIADNHGINPCLVFFDDCHVGESAYGKQPEPLTGIHNSGWVKDPSTSRLLDTLNTFPVLEKYVKDILTTFKDDKRILWWDLYNEPNLRGLEGNVSMPLLRNVFVWAREVRPSQPVSVGVWTDKESCKEMSEFQLANSDIITYHCYNGQKAQVGQIKYYKSFGRPVICTEYMARTRGSRFETDLPVMRLADVSAINWGFVSGKSNTIYAWSDPHPEGEEPEVWFHDILRTDKTPFDSTEVALIKAVNFGL